jgi:glycosyltransferase 2 family protein
MNRETNQPRMSRRRSWLTLVQGLVSVALFVWVVRHISWADLLLDLSRASPVFVALSCLLYYAGIVLSCYKWRSTLGIEEVSMPLPRLARWYLIGAFANNFLPTDIGGDLGRGFYASRYTGKPLAITRSILLERLTGLAAMLALAWVGLVVVAGQLAIGLIAAAASVLAGLIGWKLIAKIERRLPERPQELFKAAGTIWKQYRRRPRQIGLILALSLLFQLMAGFGTWINLLAVGVRLPLLAVLLVAAMAGVLGILPISVNGWGVKESLYIALLAPIGATASGILAGVLLGRALMLILSLAGVIPLVLEKKRIPDWAG